MNWNSRGRDHFPWEGWGEASRHLWLVDFYRSHSALAAGALWLELPVGWQHGAGLLSRFPLRARGRAGPGLLGWPPLLVPGSSCFSLGPAALSD